MRKTSLPKVDLVILPGGFSFGDYLRSGAMASKSKIIDEVVKHANDNRYLLGICNGFQILTEIGLLEGALIRNTKTSNFWEKIVLLKKNLKIISIYQSKIDQVLQIPVAHNEGNFYCDTETLNLLKK